MYLFIDGEFTYYKLNEALRGSFYYEEMAGIPKMDCYNLQYNEATITTKETKKTSKILADLSNVNI